MARINGGFAGGTRTTRVIERIRDSVGRGDEGRKKVLAVPCPKCGVAETKSCLGKGDQLRWAFHAERRRMAAAADAAADGRRRVHDAAADAEAERRWTWIREQMAPEGPSPSSASAPIERDRGVIDAEPRRRAANAGPARMGALVRMEASSER